MRIADAHCDTLTKYADNPFLSEKSQWNIEKFKSVGGKLQFMAIYTPPEYENETASNFATKHIGAFHRFKPDDARHITKAEDYDDNGVNLLLSLEGASPIINDLDNIHAFYHAGVRAVTLTWNHENYLASGIDSIKGITDYGREAIKEMEELGIIIDVSHLNDAGFEDLLKIHTKPFIASHSNSFAVHNHPRNLKDHQARAIIEMGGFIGINFYSDLLGPKDDDLKLRFIHHIEWLLNIGAKDVLGMGSDFDGISASPFDEVRDFELIYRMLSEELKLDEELTDKILYQNLVDYVKKML